MTLALKSRLNVFLLEPVNEEGKATFMVFFRLENNYFSSLLISKVKMNLQGWKLCFLMTMFVVSYI